MLRQLSDLNFKRGELIKMMSSLFVVSYPPAEAHSEPNKACKRTFLREYVAVLN